MPDVDWQIRGLALANCNCNWGCPCQFNALPSSGQCEALWAMRIEQGHFGDTSLDGLVWGVLIWWPGAVHEGNGRQQIFYEERATPEQRAALERIARGEVSAEGTYFQIFSATAPTFETPVAAAIDFDCDIEARKGRLVVQGLVDSGIAPIRNPVTNAEHRAHVVMPQGFEYRTAEYASGTTKTAGSAAIALDLESSHAHLYRAAWKADGIDTDGLRHPH